MCGCLFQAEDGIRELVRSRGLGDVYKRQARDRHRFAREADDDAGDVFVAFDHERRAQQVATLSLIHI